MRIFLIRHGESVANVDGKLYAHYWDHNVPLSQWGREQALEAGEALKEYLDANPGKSDKKPRVWHSPFKRTRQTTEALLEAFGEDNVDSVREDALLREQDFGIFGNIRDKKLLAEMFPDEYAHFMSSVEKDGKYYAVAHQGESLANVCDRMRSFISSQIMLNMAAGQEDMVIVAHGMANLAFEMAFMGHSPEWFQNKNTSGNCDTIMIEGDLENGFEVSCIHEGKKRPPHMPKTHKAQPYGEEPPAQSRSA